MATGNFYNVNASKVYVIECETEFDYDDTVENVGYELVELGYDLDGSEAADSLRSFYSKIIAEKYDTVSYGDTEFTITLQAIVRAGYYAHANLDWRIVVNSPEGHEWIEQDVMLEQEVIESMEYCDYPSGLARIHAPYLISKVQDMAQAMIDEVEKVYEQYTTPVVSIGTASNGETFYEKA